MKSRPPKPLTQREEELLVELLDGQKLADVPPDQLRLKVHQARLSAFSEKRKERRS